MDIGDFLEQTQWPKIEPYPWMRECHFELVTAKTIGRVIDECIQSGKYALDIESTGLDNRIFEGRTVDSIVGICLAPNSKTGYYIPIAHKEGAEHNIPRSLVGQEMRRLAASESRAIMHPAKFDAEFMEYPGGEPWGSYDSPNSFECTLTMAYLDNTRRKRKGLKYLSEELLGMKMIELKDLFPRDWKKGLNFSLLDPSDQGTLWYGGSDGICTLCLEEYFTPRILSPPDRHSQAQIYKIEKFCVPATRWMEREGLCVDLDKVRELTTLANKEMLGILENIYAQVSKTLGRDIRPGFFRWLLEKFDPAGGEAITELKAEARKASVRLYPSPTAVIPDPNERTYTAGDKIGQVIQWPPVYDLFSDTQLGQMFDEIRVPGLVLTEKSGQIKTSKDVLDGVIERSEKDFPFMRSIKTFRNLCTALSNYLVPLLAGTPDNGMIRISFNGAKVETGRFSTASSDKGKVNVGMPRVNLQATPATYNDPKDPKPESLVRLRECFVARPPDDDGIPHVIVAIDFSGEELRIVTNLSLEPLWLHAFQTCLVCNKQWDRGPRENWPPPSPPDKCPDCGGSIGDLHTVTAQNIFPDNPNKTKEEAKAERQIGKIVNFLLAYGGGGSAVSLNTGVDKNEGWRIARQFKEKYTGLTEWWDEQHTFAKQHGYILTPFGRIYPVEDINLPVEMKGGKDRNSYWRSKAERNAVNGPVQGAGSDIIKIAMALIYKDFKARGWLKKARMIITMHDELVFDVNLNILVEFIGVAKSIMTDNAILRSKKWPVPFTSDVEIGTDWTVPWNFAYWQAGKGIPDWIQPYLPEGFGSPPPQTEAEPAASPPPPAPAALPPPASGGFLSDLSEESIALPVKGGQTQAPDVQRVVSAPPQNTRPVNNKGGAADDFVFTLQQDLTVGLAHRLAKLIVKCAGGGTHPLVIKTRDGILLKDWSTCYGAAVLVNPQTFQACADVEQF